MQEAMEGAGFRGGRRRWAADEEEAAAVVEEEAAAAVGVGCLKTRAGMVGGLDLPGRRRFQKGFDWRNLWSSCWLAPLADGMLRHMDQCQRGHPVQRGPL